MHCHPHNSYWCCYVHQAILRILILIFCGSHTNRWNPQRVQKCATRCPQIWQDFLEVDMSSTWLHADISVEIISFPKQWFLVTIISLKSVSSNVYSDEGWGYIGVCFLLSGMYKFIGTTYSSLSSTSSLKGVPSIKKRFCKWPVYSQCASMQVEFVGFGCKFEYCMLYTWMKHFATNSSDLPKMCAAARW